MVLSHARRENDKEKTMKMVMHLVLERERGRRVDGCMSFFLSPLSLYRECERRRRRIRGGERRRTRFTAHAKGEICACLHFERSLSNLSLSVLGFFLLN